MDDAIWPRGRTVNGRWFDKTPQNVYGLLLLSYMYPEAKFVHIYRNPLNVVASLVEGRTMAMHSIRGGVNYWMEAMMIIHEYKKIGHHRMLELAYEDVVRDPLECLKRTCDFVGEDFSLLPTSEVKTRPEQNNYRKLLNDDDMRYVIDNTRPFFSMYGYG